MLRALIKATGLCEILDQLEHITRTDGHSMVIADGFVNGLKLQIHSALPDVEPQWRKLEASAMCTPYQTYEWCFAYFETIGRQQGLKPCIVTAISPLGQVEFILPFQIRKKFGVFLLEWLAQAENNYCQGIFTNRFSEQRIQCWLGENFSAILNSLPNFDVINLQNMPLGSLGYVDVLTEFQTSQSANPSFTTKLDHNYENLLRSKRSAKSISKLRRRDERIHASGDVEFIVEPLGSKTHAALREALTHKRLQLAAQGIHGVFDQPQENFLVALASTAKLRAFRLTCDGTTISSLVGAVSGNQFWLMITSLSPGAPLPLSPGDMLLRKVISWCCEQRLDHFDFSSGEIGYKTIWADQKILLSNYIVTRSLRGLPLAAALRAYNWLKRHVKSSEFLRDLFNDLRQKIWGSSGT